jgi:hypothetical protein
MTSGHELAHVRRACVLCGSFDPTAGLGIGTSALAFSFSFD